MPPRTTSKRSKKARKSAVSGKPARKKSAKPVPSVMTTTGTHSVPPPVSPVCDVCFALPDGKILRWDDGPLARRIDLAEFQRLAVQWAYVVRNRRRWAERTDTVGEQATRAVELLRFLGLSEATREELAAAGHVEVVIPWTSEAVGWELRIFPWEYLLTAGTRDIRRGQLSVVRRLAFDGDAEPLSAKPRVLYIQSAVGKLHERYDFSTERAIVESSLNSSDCQVLINPTLEQIERAVEMCNPDVVHLAGFDTHQGLALLNDETADEVLDGYLLQHANGSLHAVSAGLLAEAITKGASKPRLVMCNVHNSASRIAPQLLAHGVGAALGFQDTFDDGLAEVFVGSFYRALALAEGDLVLAFDLAWGALREQPRSVLGSGLVLWSRSPLFAEATRTDDTTRTSVAKQVEQERAQIIDLSKFADLGDVVQVTCEPLREANYSLLHNNRGMFKRFAIQKLQPGRLEQVLVNVELHVGADTYPYRRSFTLSEPLVDLNDLVRVPLTSALSRSRNEAMHTSLFVEVLWGPPGQERELYRDTHRVTMLPADQWRDDDSDRIWLPSFVLPRDPAVAQVIDRAQRYLMALRDDPTAGFDGYQSLDPSADDPAECIDLQVQAIWSAILYDFRLAYINPPPAYSEASQRIRTPTEILASGRGTCLDLTLLVAACLEFVEIFPVVFLLAGHAFPGYWRSDSAHAAFVEVANADLSSADLTDAHRATRTTGQREAWYLPKQSWPEMIQQVRLGELVPLESVWLTTHRGFWEAVDAGHDNLKPRAEFDSLLDVLLARGSGVTPLPIREELA